MGIPSKQIGWGTESNLLWQISKQLEWINKTAGSYTSTFVPYVGAVQDVNLGSNSLNATRVIVGEEAYPYYNTNFSVNGTSEFYGSTPNFQAIYEELLVIASGTNWTGNNAIGYTHTIGSTVPLIASTPLPINGTYQLTWVITGRTTGTVLIQFGDFYGNSTSTDGTTTFFTYSNQTPLTVSTTSNFNGTIKFTIEKIIPSTPLLSFGYGYTRYLDIRSSGDNFTIGGGAGSSLGTGIGNYLSGDYAGLYVTSGTSNTFVGESTGMQTSKGSNNIAIGSISGNLLPSGNDTIAIGATVEGNNIIAIGTRSGFVNNNVDNSTIIGNSNITSAIIYGNLLLGGTVNRNAKLDVTGPSLQNGNLFFSQPTPIAKTTGGTLLIAELLTGIITATSASAISLQLPTGTLTDAGILSGLLPNDGAFDWVVLNRGSSVGIVTITTSSGHTFIGLNSIQISSQAMFRTRKIGTNSYTTYRIS